MVLKQLGARLGFEVVAVHFDHQLRAGSKDEMARARTLAEALGIECVTGEGDVRQAAAERRQGIEETARAMRYQFLGFVSGRENASCIATGHTADDQTETVLMRVIRGSGVRGIRGMLPESTVPGAPAHRLIRPLLPLTRAETRAICVEAGLEPTSDPSNDDPSFTRNRIRAATLANLAEINPGISRALVGLAESARELFAPIERQVMTIQPAERGRFGSVFALEELASLPLEALGLIVERETAAAHGQAELNRTRLKNASDVLRKGTGSVSFGQSLLEASCGLVRIGPVLAPPRAFEPVVLTVPGVTRAGHVTIEVATEALPDRPGAWTGALDHSLSRGALRARPLAPGDRLRTAAGARSVQDLLVNAKVPKWERPGIVAITDSSQALALAGVSLPLAAPPAESALYLRLSRREG